MTLLAVARPGIVPKQCICVFPQMISVSRAARRIRQPIRFSHGADWQLHSRRVVGRVAEACVG